MHITKNNHSRLLARQEYRLNYTPFVELSFGHTGLITQTAKLSDRVLNRLSHLFYLPTVKNRVQR